MYFKIKTIEDSEIPGREKALQQQQRFAMTQAKFNEKSLI